MVAAENICIKLLMGGTNLSPVMNLWLQRCQTWNLIIIKLKGRRIGKTLILREAEKACISYPLEASLE